MKNKIVWNYWKWSKIALILSGFSVDLDLDMEEPMEVDENSNLPLQDVLPLYNEDSSETPVDENASETESHR